MDTLPPHAQNDNTVSQKQCTKCKQWKLANSDNYKRDKTRQDGWFPQCKQCCNAPRQPILPDSGYKRCTGPCGRELPANELFFHRSKRDKDGLHQRCKDCRHTVEYRSSIKKTHIPVQQKQCTGPCERTLPATSKFFARNRVSSDGFSHRCKECIRIYHDDYYSRLDVQEHKRIYDQAYQLRPGYREQHKIYSRTRRARRRAALGVHTPEQIREQHERQNGKCYYCHKKVQWGNHHVDHVIPLSRGGSNEISNLVIACSRCNLSKNNKLPHEWGGGGRLL